jgi:hypothetical protein
MGKFGYGQCHHPIGTFFSKEMFGPVKTPLPLEI